MSDNRLTEKLLVFCGKIAHLLQRVYNKAYRTYLLSTVKHGKRCQIRGSGMFMGDITLGDDVTIGSETVFCPPTQRL